MSKITCITIEDDPFISLILKNLIDLDDRLELLDQCEDSVSATLSLSRLKPSILFLDIKIPGLNGIEMLEILDIKPVVIVISGMKNIREQTISENPCIVDFVPKPIDVETFKSAVNKAIKKLKIEG